MTGRPPTNPVDKPVANPVDDAVVSYYERETLAPDTLARLTTLTETADKGTWAARATRRRALMVGGFSIAAALLLVASVSLTEKTKPGSGGPTTIAKEIALNHNKQLNIEFPAKQYTSLARSMAKLDFAPSKPNSRPCSGATLLGGRYCSIGSAIACQLKLRASDGAIQTLYQTRWANGYARLANRTIVVDGVKVRFWRERDVLFGLASSVAAKPRQQ